MDISQTQSLKLNQLSERFFGLKILQVETLEQLKVQQESNENQVRSKFSEHFMPILSQDLECLSDQRLEMVFLDYIMNIWRYSLQQGDFNLIKVSCLLEMSAHIFKESFKQRMSKEKSFDYFKEVLVRHSLFRPPQTVNVFTLPEIKLISEFFIQTFFKHYTLYLQAFTPSTNIEIDTFQMIRTSFPQEQPLQQQSGKAATIQQVEAASLNELREYLIDKETGLTQQELEAIMKGDSIHVVPKKLREQYLKQKEEEMQQKKIDLAWAKHLQRLNDDFEQKIKLQDEEFLKQIQESKNIKKK